MKYYFISKNKYNEIFNQKRDISGLIILCVIALVALIISIFMIKTKENIVYVKILVYWFMLVCIDVILLSIFSFIGAKYLKECYLVIEVSRWLFNGFLLLVLILYPIYGMLITYNKVMRKEADVSELLLFVVMSIIIISVLYIILCLLWKLNCLQWGGIAICIITFILVLLVFKVMDKKYNDTKNYFMLILQHTSQFFAISYIFFIIFFQLLKEEYFINEVIKYMDNVYKIFTIIWLIISISDNTKNLLEKK